MPGRKPDELVDIAVMIDASGSIDGEMLRDFLSETAGIMEQFNSYKIHVATFDTRVYNPQQFDSENLDSIADYEVDGGGGTDFDCMYEYLKEADIQPKRLVVFTDGFPFGSWGDENYADTVWVLHGTTAIYFIVSNTIQVLTVKLLRVIHLSVKGGHVYFITVELFHDASSFAQKVSQHFAIN